MDRIGAGCRGAVGHGHAVQTPRAAPALVPKARYRVTNWPTYDRGLVELGDLRLWIAEEALAAWAAPRRRTRGGQARFSDLAIETVLMLASVFRLPLRQAEGFVRSLMALMGLALPVPDHTTLTRRRRTVPVDSRALLTRYDLGFAMLSEQVVQRFAEEGLHRYASGHG